MAPIDDSNYKREEDLKWRRDVDHWILTYKNTQARLDDALKEIRARLDSVFMIFNGNPEMDKKGLIETLHNLADDITQVRGDLYLDKIGEPGIVKIIRKQTRKEDAQWELRKVIANGLLWIFGVSLVAAISNADRLIAFWKHVHEPTVVQQTVSEKPKSRKAKPKEAKGGVPPLMPTVPSADDLHQ